MKWNLFSRGGEAARLARERKTLAVMLGIYCRDRHGRRKGLCQQCAALHDYAMCRLDRCPFEAEKPACTDCPIHCYRKDRREEIRAVMRYAGPRMLWRHPLSALRHVLAGRRAAALPPRKRSAAAVSATAETSSLQKGLPVSKLPSASRGQL